MREHALRFSSSTPASIATEIYERHTMRQLVASRSVPPHTRMAAYPVEVVSDADEHDDTYAVGLYQQLPLSGGGSVRRELDGVSGVPTERSLERAFVGGLPTIAMFSNEPDEAHAPNCRFIFPTLPAGQARLGTVCVGWLETVVAVRRGEPLTWCYGPSYTERGYPTSCSM